MMHRPKATTATKPKTDVRASPTKKPILKKDLPTGKTVIADSIV